MTQQNKTYPIGIRSNIEMILLVQGPFEPWNGHRFDATKHCLILVQNCLQYLKDTAAQVEFSVTNGRRL
jgi:hypothetical protein